MISFKHIVTEDGFIVSEKADVIYKVNNEYSPTDDRGMIWNDPDVNVKWPIQNPILSEKDQKQPLLKDADNDFVFNMTNPQN